MELYATIFMIFVSHVLSSSTHSYSSGKKYSSHAKVRRVPIVYFQNQDYGDENTPEKAVGYIMPFLDEYRGRRYTNRERTSSETEDKLMARIPKSIISKCPRTSNREKNFFSGILNGAKRKKKSWISSAKKDKMVHIALDSNVSQPYFVNLTAAQNNNFKLNQDNKLKRIIDFSPREGTKEKYISKTDDNFESPVKKTTCCEKSSTFIPFLKTTFSNAGMGWLFLTKSPALAKHASKVKYMSDISRINAILGTEANKIERSTSQLISENIFSTTGNIINQADGKYEPKNKENRDSSNILRNLFQMRYNQKKLKQNKKKRSVHAEFFSLAQAGGKLNKTNQGVLPCQKARFYNLTGLLNAHTMQPAEYYKKRGPTFVLSCPSQEQPNAAQEMSALKELYSLEALSSSSNVQETTDKAEITHGSPDNKTPNGLGQCKIIIKYKNSSTTVSSVSSTTMEQVVLKLLMQNKDDFMDSLLYPNARLKGHQWPLTNVLVYKGKEAFNESPVIGYVMKGRRRKVPKPWDKNCPRALVGSSGCAGVGDVNRLPWVSTCCIVQTKSESKRPENVRTGTKVAKASTRHTTPQVYYSSKINRSSFYYTKSTSHKSKTTLTPDIKHFHTNKEDVLSLLEGKLDSKGNLMVLVRVPASLAQKYTSNKQLDFVLPVNNTLLRKYVKQRSIFDHFFSFKKNKTTSSPRDQIVSPYGEPYDHKQHKFDLFTSRTRFKDATLSHNKVKLSQRKAAKNTAFLNLEQLSYDCPLCGKRRDDLTSESKKEEVFGASILNSRNPWNDHCDVVELTPQSELENSTSLICHSHKKFKTLKLIQGFENGLKFYMEVPDSLINVIDNIARNDEVLSTFPTNLKETKSPEIVCCSRPETLLFKPSPNEKPVVLHLQPFHVNGQNVYLPIQGDGTHGVKTSTRKPTDEEYEDYLEITEESTTSKIQLIDESLSMEKALPFALIPAYLNLHPKNGLSFDMDVHPKQLDIGLTDSGQSDRINGTTENRIGETTENKNITTTEKNISETTEKNNINKTEKNDSETTEECTICTDTEPTTTEAVFKSKSKDSSSRSRANPISIENKWLRLAQQIENTLQNPTTAGKRVTSKHRTNVSKKPIRKSVSDMMAKLPHDKKTYVIVVKEPGDMSRFVSQADKSSEHKIDHRTKGIQQEENPLTMLLRNKLKYVL